MAEYEGYTLFRTFLNFFTKSPLFFLIALVAWLFLQFSFNTYQNVALTIQENNNLKHENKTLIINKKQLVLLREYLKSDEYIYEAAVKLGYSFKDEKIIDIDYIKKDSPNNNNNWWSRIFKN
jgi:hypothetical protein